MIRNKLKELRDNRNMSLRQFAELVQLSHTNIARFEKGYDSKGKVKGSIQIDDLKQICEKTGYSFRLFLEEVGYIEQVTLPKSQILNDYNLLNDDNKEQVQSIISRLLAEQNRLLAERNQLNNKTKKENF